MEWNLFCNACPRRKQPYYTYMMNANHSDAPSICLLLLNKLNHFHLVSVSSAKKKKIRKNNTEKMNCHWLLCKVKKINFKTKHIQMENCRFHYRLFHSMAFLAHCRSYYYQQITTNRRTFNLFETIFEQKKIQKDEKKRKTKLSFVHHTHQHAKATTTIKLIVDLLINLWRFFFNLCRIFYPFLQIFSRLVHFSHLVCSFCSRLSSPDKTLSSDSCAILTDNWTKKKKTTTKLIEIVIELTSLFLLQAFTMVHAEILQNRSFGTIEFVVLTLKCYLCIFPHCFEGYPLIFELFVWVQGSKIQISISLWTTTERKLWQHWQLTLWTCSHWAFFWLYDFFIALTIKFIFIK